MSVATSDWRTSATSDSSAQSTLPRHRGSPFGSESFNLVQRATSRHESSMMSLLDTEVSRRHIGTQYFSSYRRSLSTVAPEVLIFDITVPRGTLTRAPLGSGESHILLGAGRIGPPVISQTTGPISKNQTPFDSPVRELSKHGVKYDLEVTDDVTGQFKVRMLDFSGLLTSASTISMLSANKVNELAWIVSLTSVSIISCAL